MASSIHAGTLVSRSPLDYYARRGMEAGPSTSPRAASKRRSELSGRSVLTSNTATDDTPPTPPRTPSTFESSQQAVLDHGSIPVIRVNHMAGDSDDEDIDGVRVQREKVMSASTRHRSSTNTSPEKGQGPPGRKQSSERTRTWAEDVERQMKKAEKRAEWEKDEAENQKLLENTERAWSSSHNRRRDRATDRTFPPFQSPTSSRRHESTAKETSARVIQALARASAILSSSSDDIDETSNYEHPDNAGQSAPSNVMSKGSEPGHLINAKVVVERQPLDQKPSSATATPVKVSNNVSKTPTPILSINDIVKKHQEAMDSAMSSAKSKARAEMGLSPTSTCASASSTSLPRYTNPPVTDVSGPASAISEMDEALEEEAVMDDVEEEQFRVQSPLSNIQSTVTDSEDQRAEMVTGRTHPNAGTAMSPTQAFFMGNTTRSRPPPSSVITKNLERSLVGADQISGPTSSADSPGSFGKLRNETGPSRKDGQEVGLLDDLMIGQQLLQRLDQNSVTSSPTPSHKRSSKAPTVESVGAETASLASTSAKRQSSYRSSEDGPGTESHTMALYLRSPNLNRYLQLPRPYPDRPLHVSLAEVGSPTGSPVLMFLGLGCVRYLIALFDDFAKALNLRLICIDRWGYGKTDPVPVERRSPVLWAPVVERVMDEMQIKSLRIVAHSAGSPFAAAVALRMGERVKGNLHFLAPWVSSDIDGGYKWLKWVPNGIIKSATAAEWKLQSYLLGKPPPLKHKPISHTAETITSPSDTLSPLQKRPLLEHKSNSEGTPRPGAAASLVDIPVESLLSPSPKPRRTPSVMRRASNVFSRNDNLSKEKENGKSGGSPIIKHLRSSVLLRTHSDDTNSPSSRSSLKTVNARQSSDPTTRTSLTSGRRDISSPLRSSTYPLSPPLTDQRPLSIATTTTAEPHEGDVLEFLADGFSLHSFPSSPSPTPQKRFSALNPFSPTPKQSSRTPTDARTTRDSASFVSSTTTTDNDGEGDSKPSMGPTLMRSLMQASHAECEPGTTTELLSIVLGRQSHSGATPTSWGFSYTDVTHPAIIHWGDEDDKVSEKSVRWMERSMVKGGAKVRVLNGEGHNLLTSVGVMCDVFEMVRKEINEEKKATAKATVTPTATPAINNKPVSAAKSKFGRKR